jgi:alpha-1,6-mannosyltransferase
MLRAFYGRVGPGWAALGLVGSLTSTVAATGLLAHRPTRWWWQLSLGSHGVQWHLFWAGIVLLCLAWAGLGWRLARRPGARPADLVWVGALWSVPLVLGPALLSLDTYSYLAQGAVLAHGLNPYHSSPQALHEPGLLAGVSSTWRHTTTPYGPLFIGLAALAAGAAGSHLALGIMLLRIPELLGLGLLAWSVPRLARTLGADPARATWLAVISPLSLLYLVAGAHNDALMVGLMAAGVALAVERRPLAGIALCTLAATVKLPAAAAIVMIAICCWRAEPARRRQVALTGALVVAGVALLIGVLTGVGFSWISASLFSTPATARMALTPSTAVAVTLWEITHHFGSGVEQAAAAWENAATLTAFVLVGLFAAALCLRVRYATLPRYLGLALIAAALGGPAAWPWYLSWGIVMLAADRKAQRSPWLPAVLLACAFPVMAGGQVAIPLPDAWWIVILYAAAVLVAVLRRRRRVPGAVPVAPAPASAPASAPAPGPVHPERVSVSPIGHAAANDSSPIVTSELGG